jgi:hypothetical protein
MTVKKIALAALAGTVLLAAAPAFADNYRGGRHDYRGNHFQQRVVVVHRQAPYYMQRRVVVQRPVVVRQQPVVVYRQHSSHELLGGLILGAVIGAAIANHAGY